MRNAARPRYDQPAMDSAEETLHWEVRALRQPQAAANLVRDLAGFLPMFAPRDGLLLLDWELVGDGGTWRAQPRLDLHSEPWLALPRAAIRPTAATVTALCTDEGERLLTLELPPRGGRRQAPMTLASGLMRLSMQAHDAQARFLPVIQRSELGEDRAGNPTLHLHRLDLSALTYAQDPVTRKQLTTTIAERVLALMSIPGGGREQPLLLGESD